MDGWMDRWHIMEDFVFQEKECASLYSMKMYVEPNEIEPSLVRAHQISHFDLIFFPTNMCSNVSFFPSSLKMQFELCTVTKLQDRMNSASARER